MLSISCFTMRIRKYFPITYSSGERSPLKDIRTIFVVCNFIQPWTSKKCRVRYSEYFGEFSKINGLSVGRKLLNSKLRVCFRQNRYQTKPKIRFSKIPSGEKKWFWRTTCACSGDGEVARLLVASDIWELLTILRQEKSIDPSAILVDITFEPICKYKLQK